LPDAVIVATARSPIGKAFKGSLKDVRPDDLAATVIRAALDKVPAVDPDSDVDDLMLGCGLPGGEHGFNMARVVAVLLGYDHLPGTTITRYCSSSLQTTRMAFHAIRAGEGDCFISAGTEVVSRYVSGNSDSLPGTRNEIFAEAHERGKRWEAGEAPRWHDPRADGELPDMYVGMVETAEHVAQVADVSRIEQDTFAALSQQRAAQAIESGFFDREIVPVSTPDGQTVTRDDSPRPGTTAEILADLKPVFNRGTITAGNACPLNDGAAAVLVMSDERARELGVTPLARIVATGLSALAPEIMGLGPVESSRRALALAGMTIEDVDLVEINEAFASQVVASYRELGIDVEKLNVHGGAIALGHPFGMTGARMITTLINGLQTHDKAIGLATMCVGGGQGLAVIVERLH
jgi:acetyl-CoA C-acetyltransferase